MTRKCYESVVDASFQCGVVAVGVDELVRIVALKHACLAARALCGVLLFEAEAKGGAIPEDLSEPAEEDVGGAGKSGNVGEVVEGKVLLGEEALHFDHAQVLVVEVGFELSLFDLYVTLSGFSLNSFDLQLVVLPVLLDLLCNIALQERQELLSSIA